MADSKLPSASAEESEKQRKDTGWPVPGDEGFVHPDGTPESVRQLEGNRQAQADRDHAGLVSHGAPLATPGPQANAITAEKVENARKNDAAEADEGNWVERSLRATAKKVAAGKSTDSQSPNAASK